MLPNNIPISDESLLHFRLFSQFACVLTSRGRWLIIHFQKTIIHLNQIQRCCETTQTLEVHEIAQNNLALAFDRSVEITWLGTSIKAIRPAGDKSRAAKSLLNTNTIIKHYYLVFYTSGNNAHNSDLTDRRRKKMGCSTDDSIDLFDPRARSNWLFILFDAN